MKSDLLPRGAPLPSSHLYDLPFLLALTIYVFSKNPEFILKTTSTSDLFRAPVIVNFIQWPLTFRPTSFRIHLMQLQNMWGNGICAGRYHLAALSVYRIDTSVCPADRFSTFSHPKNTVAGSYADGNSHSPARLLSYRALLLPNVCMCEAACLSKINYHGLCVWRKKCVRRDRGPGLLKAAVGHINIHAPTRFSKEEQGVTGDAGEITARVQRWRGEKCVEERSTENNTGVK